MGRKRTGKPIHGWLVIDKPTGVSSNAVVGRVRRATGAAKVGHGGTLDPLASGILPLALGEATKTVSFAMDGIKTYRFGLRFGEARETDDAEGEVTETHDYRPSDAEIEAVLPAFVGDIEQVPPIYSAVKVDGKRAYARARADESFELQPRVVHIQGLKMLERSSRDEAIFEVVSGKGMYVRSLARDLAKRLGTVGYVSSLRRTRVGPFDEKSAISLDNLDDLGHSAPLSRHLLGLQTALADIPALALTEQEARRLHHGQAIPVLPVALRSPLDDLSPPIGSDGTVLAVTGDKPIALAKIAGAEIRPVRVLNIEQKE